jgi:hypothetical protein
MSSSRVADGTKRSFRSDVEDVLVRSFVSGVFAVHVGELGRRCQRSALEEPGRRFLKRSFSASILRPVQDAHAAPSDHPGLFDIGASTDLLTRA